MRKSEKVQKVSAITEKLTEAKSFYITDFSGLNVEEISDLRQRFRKSSVDYQVIKNTLARIAIKEQGFDDLLGYLEGPTAIAFALEEPAAPVKIIKSFLKEHRDKENPTIRACMFEGEILDSSKVDELADLPSREALLSMLLGGLNGTLSGLVFVLNGLMSKMVRTLKAIEDKKSAE